MSVLISNKCDVIDLIFDNSWWKVEVLKKKYKSRFATAPSMTDIFIYLTLIDRPRETVCFVDWDETAVVEGVRESIRHTVSWGFSQNVCYYYTNCQRNELFAVSTVLLSWKYYKYSVYLGKICALFWSRSDADQDRPKVAFSRIREF